MRSFSENSDKIKDSPAKQSNKKGKAKKDKNEFILKGSNFLKQAMGSKFSFKSSKSKKVKKTREEEMEDAFIDPNAPKKVTDKVNRQ